MAVCVNDLPASLNISIYRGATFSVGITWESGDPAEPVNLTGYTADMKVKDGPVLVTELTTGNGRIVLGSDGTIALTIPATVTAALEPSNCNYDLLLSSPGGVVTALVSGLCVIKNSVSA